MYTYTSCICNDVDCGFTITDLRSVGYAYCLLQGGYYFLQVIWIWILQLLTGSTLDIHVWSANSLFFNIISDPYLWLTLLQYVLHINNWKKKKYYFALIIFWNILQLSFVVILWFCHSNKYQQSTTLYA